MKYLVQLFVFFVAAAGSAYAGNDPYLSEIVITPASFCPTAFLQASGQSLPVAQNQALYSLIGNTFGGNSQAFNLPNIKPTYDANGKILLPCIALSGVFPSRP